MPTRLKNSHRRQPMAVWFLRQATRIVAWSLPLDHGWTHLAAATAAAVAVAASSTWGWPRSTTCCGIKMSREKTLIRCCYLLGVDKHNFCGENFSPAHPTYRSKSGVQIRGGEGSRSKPVIHDRKLHIVALRIKLPWCAKEMASTSIRSWPFWIRS